MPCRRYFRCWTINDEHGSYKAVPSFEPVYYVLWRLCNYQGSVEVIFIITLLRSATAILIKWSGILLRIRSQFKPKPNGIIPCTWTNSKFAHEYATGWLNPVAQSPYSISYTKRSWLKSRLLFKRNTYYINACFRIFLGPKLNHISHDVIEWNVQSHQIFFCGSADSVPTFPVIRQRWMLILSRR